MSASLTEKLKELHLTLPPAPKPAGSYRPVVMTGRFAFLSGQISRKADGSLITGKVGRDLTLEQGQEAARTSALNVLSIIQEWIGYAKFDRMLRMTGYVQCAPDFHDISAVINGASDFFLAVLGEQGVHARSAVGMASLPMNAAVEIEVTLQLKA